MSPPDGTRAEGQEVLVIDGDKNVLKGLERLLQEAGLTVSTLTDAERARDQLEKRFIPIVLADLDTPTPGAAVDLLQFVKERSPLSVVIVMTARKGYEAVAPAFRAGAFDVIPKTADMVSYVRERVVAAAAQIRDHSGKEALLADLSEAHEEFLRKMMDLQRHLTEIEDKLLQRDESSPSAASMLDTVNVLFVDDDTMLKAVMEKTLAAEKGWRLRYTQSGGEALDAASQTPPQILVVKELLPDLPGTMVVKTIKGNAPDAVALLFSPPGEGTVGEVRMVEQSRLHTLVPSFSTPEQLVDALEQLRTALRQKAKERRHIQIFRNQHFEFVKRYQGLKQRLDKYKPKA